MFFLFYDYLCVAVSAFTFNNDLQFMQIFLDKAFRWKNICRLPNSPFVQDRIATEIYDFYAACFHKLERIMYADGKCHVEYNADNFATSITWLSDKGRPCKGPMGCVTTHIEYECDDELNVRLVTMTFFDARGKACRNWKNSRQVRYELDENAALQCIDYSGPDGTDLTSDCVSRYVFAWTSNEDVVQVFELSWMGFGHGGYAIGFDKAHRFVTSWSTLDEKGAIEQDEDGGYGSNVERYPDTHLPYRLWNLNLRRTVCPAADGVVYWEESYPDAHCEVVRYFDAEGKPTANIDGVFGKAYMYDEYYNLQTSINLDADAKPMADLNGELRCTFTFDKNGRITSNLLFGQDESRPFGVMNRKYGMYQGAPSAEATYILTEGGTSEIKLLEWEWYPEKAHRIKTKTDKDQHSLCPPVAEVQENGRLTILAHLAEENMSEVLDSECYSYFGQEVRLRRLDKDQQPVADKHGAVDYVTKLDEWGRTQIKSQLDANGKKVPGSDNQTYVSEAYAYGDQSNAMSVQYGDEENHLVPCKEGYCMKISYYDEKEHIVRDMFYDDSNRPCQDNVGVYGVAYTYDDEDPLYLMLTCLDKDAKPLRTRIGYTHIQREMDINGRVLRELWLREDKKPFRDQNGNCGVMNTYSGRVTETIALDANGDPHCDMNGVAVIRTEVDEQGREIRVQGLDLDGNPVANSDGNADFQTIYNDKGRCEIHATYDENGNLHEDDKGVARTETYRNSKGQVVRVVRYNSHLDPALDKNGCCGEQADYTHPRGEEREYVCSLDAHLNPLVLPDGVCWRRVERDEYGRIVKSFNLDETRRPCADKNGVYVTRFTYNKDDGTDQRVLEFDFLDRRGAVTCNVFGVSRVLYIYDSDGNRCHLEFDEKGRFTTSDYDPDTD